MQELTMRQMSEMDGSGMFRRRFFDGFLCGVSVAGAIAITPTTSVLTRLAIYGTVISACGSAFFG
jgi:hypothetical protein